MNGRLSMVQSECFHPSLLALRETFKHGEFRGKAIPVKDVFDRKGRSVHRMCFDGMTVIGASRETLFAAQVNSPCGSPPEEDLIKCWTGFEIPNDEPRLIVSRVVVRPGSDRFGVQYRGAGINERFFFCALARGLRLNVNVYCVVKEDLFKQRAKLRSFGFREIGKATSEDIPGQPVPVVVMENVPRHTHVLWKPAFNTTEKELETKFPKRYRICRPTKEMADRVL